MNKTTEAGVPHERLPEHHDVGHVQVDEVAHRVALTERLADGHDAALPFAPQVGVGDVQRSDRNVLPVSRETTATWKPSHSALRTYLETLPHVPLLSLSLSCLIALVKASKTSQSTISHFLGILT